MHSFPIAETSQIKLTLEDVETFPTSHRARKEIQLN